MAAPAEHVKISIIWNKKKRTDFINCRNVNTNSRWPLTRFCSAFCERGFSDVSSLCICFFTTRFILYSFVLASDVVLFELLTNRSRECVFNCLFTVRNRLNLNDSFAVNKNACTGCPFSLRSRGWVPRQKLSNCKYLLQN